jgi:hypothetical protein
MLHPSDIMVCCWAVPILSLFFVSLYLAVTAVFHNMGQRFFLAREMSNEEKRRHPRFSISKDTFAKITVGDTTCTGLVYNVSKTGVSLKNLPKMISNEIDKLSVVISQYGVDYNLLFRTKWVELTESGKQIGAEVDSTSADWSKFLRLIEKKGRTEPV